MGGVRWQMGNLILLSLPLYVPIGSYQIVLLYRVDHLLAYEQNVQYYCPSASMHAKTYITHIRDIHARCCLSNN